MTRDKLDRILFIQPFLKPDTVRRFGLHWPLREGWEKKVIGKSFDATWIEGLMAFPASASDSMIKSHEGTAVISAEIIKMIMDGPGITRRTAGLLGLSYPRKQGKIPVEILGNRIDKDSLLCCLRGHGADKLEYVKVTRDHIASWFKGPIDRKLEPVFRDMGMRFPLPAFWQGMLLGTYIQQRHLDLLSYHLTVSRAMGANKFLIERMRNRPKKAKRKYPAFRGLSPAIKAYQDMKWDFKINQIIRENSLDFGQKTHNIWVL